MGSDNEHVPHEFQTLRAGAHHVGIMCTRCGMFLLVDGWFKHLCGAKLSPWEIQVIESQRLNTHKPSPG